MTKTFALLEDLVRLRRRRAVRPFGDERDVRADLAGVVAADLVLERGRDQDVDVLLEPCVAGRACSKPRPFAFCLSIAPNLSVIPCSSSKSHARRRGGRCTTSGPPGPTTRPRRPCRRAGVYSWIAYCATLPKPCTLAVVPSGVLPCAFERFAQRVDDAVAGGFGASERAAHADRFAGDEPGMMAVPLDGLVFVEHPDHVLRRGHHVRRRHVGQLADVARDLANPSAADLLLLAHAQVVRIANDPALAAAERDVDDRALPRHPHGERAHGVDGFLRVEADAPFGRAARVVVLHAEALEHLDVAVVHADRE